MSFAEPINIPGCVEQVHRPILNLKTTIPEVLFDCAIVFRAGAGKLGVLWLTRMEGSGKDIFGEMPINNIIKEF